MSSGSARIYRLEDKLRGGLRFDLPLAMWPPLMLSRLESPALLASLTDDELDWLIAQAGDEADEPAEPITPTTVDTRNGSHGFAPMARICGCSSCAQWRSANGVEEPEGSIEARRMWERCRALTNAHRRELGLEPLP